MIGLDSSRGLGYVEGDNKPRKENSVLVTFCDKGASTFFYKISIKDILFESIVSNRTTAFKRKFLFVELNFYYPTYIG